MLSTKQERQESVCLRHWIMAAFGGNRLNAGAPKLRGKKREFKAESSCKCGISEALHAKNSSQSQKKRLALPHEPNAPRRPRQFEHLGKAL